MATQPLQELISSTFLCESRWRCSRQTLWRRVRAGILGPPIYLGRERLWTVEQVSAAEIALAAAYKLTGIAADGPRAKAAAAAAREARALHQLEAAAARHLREHGAGSLARVLRRFGAKDGRPASISLERRAEATQALKG